MPRELDLLIEEGLIHSVHEKYFLSRQFYRTSWPEEQELLVSNRLNAEAKKMPSPMIFDHGY